MSLSLFAEDTLVGRFARRKHLQVYRRPVFLIDEKELPAEYWRRTPDYAKIRKHLELGVVIPGAKATGDTEYVLSGARQESH